MKKKIILFVVLVSSNANYAQVSELTRTGINNLNPLTTLHVDGAYDSSSKNPDLVDPSLSQQSDDFVVTSAGNIGLGLIHPTHKFDIKTKGTSTAPVLGMRYIDGFQKDGYGLTSDENGLANWQPLDVTIYKTVFDSSYSFESNEDKVFYTGKNITFAPGYWMVYFTIITANEVSNNYQPGSNVLRLRFMDSTNPSNTSANSSNVSADAYFPKVATTSFSSSENRGIFYGSLAINNNTSSPKTYYLFGDQYIGDIFSRVTLQFSGNETFIYYYRIAHPN